MDPFEPIAGISVEHYAELAADVSEISDPAEQTAVVGRKGVNAQSWDAAKAGWTARMQDPSTASVVAARFMPLYNAALGRKSSSAHAVSGAMPGVVPPKGYGSAPQYPAAPPAPAYAAATPGYPPGYAGAPAGAPAYPPGPPAYAPPTPGGAPAYPPAAHGYPPGAPQPGYPPQQPYAQPQINQQAAAFGNEVGNAFNAFGNALGSFVSGAVGISIGSAVLVQWSDGKRYPGKVIMMQNGQVHVAFPDGRQVWVAQSYVTPRSAAF